MGGVARPLEREHEIIRRLGCPTPEAGRLLRGIEGAVDLDRGHVAARMRKLAHVRQTFGIKGAAPGLEDPTTNTDANHRRTTRLPEQLNEQPNYLKANSEWRLGKKEDRGLYLYVPITVLYESFARLIGALQCLGEPLERELVRTTGTTGGGALHGQVGAFAHGVEHAGLLRHVLDPGTVFLSVHRELRGSDLGGRLRAFLEGIADNDRHLIAHVLGRASRNEQKGRVARAAGRIGR